MTSEIMKQLCMGIKLSNRKKPKTPDKSAVETHVDRKELPVTKLQGKPEKVQNRLRTHHGIGVWGDDIPPLMTEFSQLAEKYKCSEQLLNNVKALGYEKPTPVQMMTIPAMLENREVLVSAPTGSGKTAAFLIPLIHKLGRPSSDGFRAVVVCPTRELAKQTYRETMQLVYGTGLRPYVLTKTSNAQNRFALDTAKSLDIMITTPNRLVWLLEETELCLKKVRYLIIDESDRLFEAGKSGFRDQLVKIYAACDCAQLRKGMFSATTSKDLDKWCRLNLDSVVIIAVGAKNSASKQVQQKLLFVGSEHGKLLEIKKILTSGVKLPALIFAETKSAAQHLHSNLILDGLNVDVIHSDRSVSDRDSIIDQFRLGRIWILICTELMGRGIDFKGVQLVINYDFPQTAASYIHRIGRTGRAGNTGEAITFFTENDAPKLREIVQVVRKAGCEVPEYMLRLNTKRLKNRLKAKQNKLKLSKQKTQMKRLQPATKQGKTKKNNVKRVKSTKKASSKTKNKM